MWEFTGPIVGPIEGPIEVPLRSHWGPICHTRIHESAVLIQTSDLSCNRDGVCSTVGALSATWLLMNGYKGVC